MSEKKQNVNNKKIFTTESQKLKVDGNLTNSINCKNNSSQFLYGLYKKGRTERIGSFSCLIKDQSNIFRIVTSKHNCLENGEYYLKSTSGKTINLQDRKLGKLDYATFSINPPQDFIEELLGLEKSSFADQDKITAFEKQCENISTGTNGDSGGNLHSSNHKYYGVYNSNQDLTKNVHIDTILGLEKSNYIG